MGNAIGAGLGIIGQVMDHNGKVAQAEAMGQQAIMQMNYSFQNYEMQRQDLFDAKVNEIAKLQSKSANTQATIDTAIGESMGEGRTAKLLARASQGRDAQKLSSVEDNFDRRSGEIDLNKEAVYKSTLNYTQGIKTPSVLGALVGIGSTVMGVMNQGKNAETNAKLKGIDFSWGDYMWGKDNLFADTFNKKPKKGI